MLSIKEVDGRNLIVLWAPGGQNRPYKAPESVTANKKTWRCYIRRYSSSPQLSSESGGSLIEDMLDPTVYEELVLESYASELKCKALKLNMNIPRVAKRIEAGLAELGIPFHKTRPTRLFLKKMASEPEKMLPTESLERFEALFALINSRLDKQVLRSVKPFEG